MSNRFTETEKWKDPWFCELDLQHKLFWLYLCDTCDHAGIWQVNIPLVKFHIPDLQYNPDNFKDRVVILSKEKWFIKKFVLYQQKVNSLDELNPSNKCHASIINILEKEKILSPLEAPAKGLGRGYSKGNSKVMVKVNKYKEERFQPVPNNIRKEIDQLLGRIK